MGNAAGAGAGRFPFVLPERYTYLGALVGGAQGQLVKLRDEKMRRLVALKILQAPHNQVVRRRFRAEVAALLELAGHPNVVSLYDYEESDQHLLLFMEYCEQGSLAGQVGQDSPLPLAEVLQLGAQVAAGLAAAHARGIVHRDIKPGNLLRSRDAVKIADFGIATLAELDTPARTRTRGAGTDHYTAPEVLAGAAATPASDVYSLAVTLTELAGASTADLVAADEPDRTQTGGPPLLAASARPVRDLLAGMLASQPASRPSAAAAAARLQAAAQRVGRSAESPGNFSSAAAEGQSPSAMLTEGSPGQLKRGKPPPAPLWRLPRKQLTVTAAVIAVAAIGIVVWLTLAGHGAARGSGHQPISASPFAGGILTARPDRGEPPTYLAFGSRGRAQGIVVLSTSTGKVVKLLPIANCCTGLQGGGSALPDLRHHRLFVPANLADVYNVVDSRTGQVTGHAVIGGQPAAISANGKVVAIENVPTGVISVVNLVTRKERAWTDNAALSVNGLTWSPDGQDLVLTTPTGIDVLPVNGPSQDISAGHIYPVDPSCQATNIVAVPGTDQVITAESCGRRAVLAYFDLKTKRTVRRIPVSGAGPPANQQPRPVMIDLSVDGSGRHVIGDWADPSRNNPVFVVRGHHTVVIGHAGLSGFYGWY